MESMRFVYLVLGLAAVYVATVSGMYLAQTRLLFPTQLAEGSRTQLPASAQRLEIGTPDGERLVGVRVPAAIGSAEPSQLLLGFGGNAWNADDVALYLHQLFPGAEVVAFHYRGYRPSGGHPSAQALLVDALVLFDHLQQLSTPGRMVAVGFSIGAGVAAYLARHRPLAGTILVTPFDSLERLARDHYPWAPVGLLLRHRLPTVDFVRATPTPTALIAAGRDRVVPARRSEPLRRAAPRLVFDRTVADAGHNDLYHHPAFAEAMHAALARIEATAGKGAGATGGRGQP
jgi:pimeloyl-ACP methyl ester carboxylesterase